MRVAWELVLAPQRGSDNATEARLCVRRNYSESEANKIARLRVRPCILTTHPAVVPVHIEFVAEQPSSILMGNISTMQRKLGSRVFDIPVCRCIGPQNQTWLANLEQILHPTWLKVNRLRTRRYRDISQSFKDEFTGLCRVDLA
jgi:hypothetical protein